MYAEVIRAWPFANLGMPLLLTWMLTTMAFERGIGNRKWTVACGVCFGLAVLTKVDALFLPVLLAGWGLLYYRKKALPNLIAMAVGGGLFFFLGWPALWHHPIAGTWRYLADKAARKHIPVYYLGTAYRTGQPAVPWHYPFVMLAVTTPLLTLICGGVAVTRFFQGLRTQWKDRPFEALVLLNAAFPVFLFAMPGTPKYDGARLLMTAFPFIAILAALGAERLWQRIRSKAEQKARLGRGLGAVCAVWLLLPVVVFHPFQLSYYNELAGGPWGAHALGFETTYWGDTLTDEALNWLNENTPPGARVARLAVGDFVWQLYGFGALRKDLYDAEFSGNWDYLLVVPRQGMLSPGETAWLEAHQPVWRKTLPLCGQLPLCEIYAKSSLR